ncbi:MAG: efflux RND transporter permease subunit, partial [Planctomycetes bacterium]|nr:efflux RND transporter permease subunit [Planctomycetota bacterium]
MSLPNFALNKRTVTAFTTGLFLVSGMFAYTQLGQLEDPEFTVKTAVITTSYPGASAEEVELEVTDRIEIALQEMPQIKHLESNSRPGTSNITVEILAKYPSGDLPQIWDELRKKVSDVRTSLPPGVGEPIVGDDFGDVYGFLLAVTADGFTYAQLEDYVDAMKKELSRVDGVSRVELWGEQTRCIYLDTTEAKLSQLGVTMEDLHDTLTQQNLVVDSGGVDLSVERLRIEQTGAFTSPQDIGDLVVRGRTRPRIAANDELLRIRDVATIRRGYIQPPFRVMRYRDETTAGIDELPTLGIAISNVSGVNVVELGHAMDRRLEELQRDLLPVGIEFHRVSWQSDAVTESIDSFMISLAQAVAIVLAVLWIAMGFRVAMIVGLCGLVFTIIISFLFMGIMGIDLQRMSLGALIIAMGMMVDNAIVVADGILVRVRKGMDRTRAALEAAT